MFKVRRDSAMLSILLIIAFVVVGCTLLQPPETSSPATDQATAPVGPDAYPPYGSCSSNTLPDLPQKWFANALLTPFQSQPLQVARVLVAAVLGGENEMVVTTGMVDGDVPEAWYIQGDRSYSLSSDSNGNLTCSPASTNRLYRIGGENKSKTT